MGLRVIPTWPDGLAVTTPTGETVVFSPRFFFFLFALSHIFFKFFFLDVIFPSPFLSPEFDVISF